MELILIVVVLVLLFGGGDYNQTIEWSDYKHFSGDVGDYKLDAPKGVRGRNSDNTLIQKRLAWAPSVRLEDGMRKTYDWIYQEMMQPATGHNLFK